MRVTRKTLIIFILTTLFLYISIPPFGNVHAQENGLFEYELVYRGGIRVTLQTPWYVNSNSSFNVTLVISAEHADLQNITIEIVKIISFINESEYSLPVPSPIKINELKYGTNYTESFEIILPENASKIVMGEIDCSWVVPPKAPENQHTMFPIAIISDYWKKQADYWKQQAQNLKDERDWYKMQYETLEGNLTDLQKELNQTRHQLESKMGELSVTQRLAVIFGVTTALFVFTTVYLFKRKPQVW